MTKHNVDSGSHELNSLKSCMNFASLLTASPYDCIWSFSNFKSLVMAVTKPRRFVVLLRTPCRETLGKRASRLKVDILENLSV